MGFPTRYKNSCTLKSQPMSLTEGHCPLESSFRHRGCALGYLGLSAQLCPGLSGKCFCFVLSHTPCALIVLSLIFNFPLERTHSLAVS